VKLVTDRKIEQVVDFESEKPPDVDARESSRFTE